MLVPWRGVEIPLGMSSCTNIYYQNVRGLRTKADECLANVAGLENSSIIYLTETCLNETCYSYDYFTPQYCVFRSDRLRLDNHDVRGGGVLVVVPKNIQVVRRSDFEYTDYSVMIELKLSTGSMLLGVFYLPPNLTNNEFSDIFGDLENKISGYKHDLLILGDFNLPKVKWDVYDSNSCVPIIAAKASVIRNFIRLFGMKQQNLVLNKDGNMLDLIFYITDEAVVKRPHYALVTEDSYHPALRGNHVHRWVVGDK